jgi:hypothetical protein
VNQSALTHAGKVVAEKLSAQSAKYDVNDFVAAFAKKYREAGADSDEPLRWSKVTNDVFKYFSTVHTVGFLSGQIASEMKEKAARQAPKRAALKVTEKAVVPQLLEDASMEEKTQTDARVTILTALVQKKCHEGVNLYKLVINPGSFSQSVENIFDLSFVVKLGKCGIYLDGDGIPRVIAKEAKPEEGGPENNQLVLSFSNTQWRSLIDAFDIRTTLIATRKRGNYASFAGDVE